MTNKNKPVVLTGPPPTLEEIAKMIGATKRDVERIKRLINKKDKKKKNCHIKCKKPDTKEAIPSSTHTPGPWRVESRPDAMKVSVYGSPREDGSDYAPICSFGDRSRLPDACLIAAAPRLLEVLKEARLQIQYLHEKFQETSSGNMVLNRINIAIQEATNINHQLQAEDRAASINRMLQYAEDSGVYDQFIPGRES